MLPCSDHYAVAATFEFLAPEDTSRVEPPLIPGLLATPVQRQSASRSLFQATHNALERGLKEAVARKEKHTRMAAGLLLLCLLAFHLLPAAAGAREFAEGARCGLSIACAVTLAMLASARITTVRWALAVVVSLLGGALVLFAPRLLWQCGLGGWLSMAAVSCLPLGVALTLLVMFSDQCEVNGLKNVTRTVAVLACARGGGVSHSVGTSSSLLGRRPAPFGSPARPRARSRASTGASTGV